MTALKLIFYQVQYSVIRRKPLHFSKMVFRQPFRGFMLTQLKVAGNDVAKITMHRKMERRIIMFDCAQEPVNGYLGGQFLADFSLQGFFRALPGFHLASREFPIILEFSVTALGCEYPASRPDHRGDHFYPFSIVHILYKDNNSIDYSPELTKFAFSKTT